MLKAKVEISKTQLKTGVFRICIFTIKLIFEKFGIMTLSYKNSTVSILIDV